MKKVVPLTLAMLLVAGFALGEVMNYTLPVPGVV